MAAPALSRAIICPACRQALTLDYELSRDRLSTPTLFECPACETAHTVELPGPLRRVRRL